MFDLLNEEKRVDFFKSIIAKCRKQNKYGLSAGSFMLGRFLAKPLPKTFWEPFYPNEIAFMLNEYVLYEKYLAVLQEVGEQKLVRTHSKIESTNLKEIELRNLVLYNFVPLMKVEPDWDSVKECAMQLNDLQDNTLFIINSLSQPIEKTFNMDIPYVRSKVEEMAEL